MKIAIVDNAALVNFTWLKDQNIFNHLRLLFKGIHIPMGVKTEYERILAREPDRYWFLALLSLIHGMAPFRIVEPMDCSI